MHRVGKLVIQGGEPIRLDHSTSESPAEPSKEQSAVIEQLGATVREYMKSVHDLLEGRYAALKDLAPTHHRDPCRVLAFLCGDGLVLRYERKTDAQGRMVIAWSDQSLSEFVPKISEGMAYCHATRDFVSSILQTGVEFRLSRTSPTGQSEDVLAFRMGIDTVLEKPEFLPKPPLKPYCLLSAHNSIEIQLQGELVDIGREPGTGQNFLARTLFRMNVGWECIEVFPFFDLEHWKPEYAKLWAENDLLAALVARQLHESQLNSIDPLAGARTYFSGVLSEYSSLLDTDPEREETLHAYLRDHPALICPAHTAKWSKLALGAHFTDFVFRDALGEYVLVELERSTLPLFKADGDTSYDLNHARNQILDWRRYIEDNLATVQREIGLKGISSNLRSIVIIGRSKTLTEGNRRKLITIENESPRTKIMTYDDVLLSARAIAENLFGPLNSIQGNTQIYYLPRI
jgi:hypothetical protein